jgi:hypothetical protein
MPPVDQNAVIKAYKGSRTPQEIKDFIAEWVLVGRYHDEIHRIINPPEFAEAAQNVFLENEAVKRLHKDFRILEFECGTIYPDKCPPDMRDIAEKAADRPVHASQKLLVAIPNKHLESGSHLAFDVFEISHGGGGVSNLSITDTVNIS